MKRAVLALASVLVSSHALAQVPSAPSPAAAAPNDGLAPLDRRQPAAERNQLEKGTPDERTRVLARAAERSPESDEAVALLAFAAERARPLELRSYDLVLAARGLSRRSATKLARDGLFALLSTPPRDGIDGQGLHQQIAAIALAAAAHIADPPAELPAKPEDAKPRPDTLQKLLELADEPRLEAAITQALLRHPPRRAPRSVAGPAAFRIGARLGDLRWIPLIDSALRGSGGDEALLVAALSAAADLGDTHALPRARALAAHPSLSLATAALHAWATLEPKAGVPAVEKALTRPGAPLSSFVLARHVESPGVLAQLVQRLLESDAATLPSALRVLASLPHGAGAPALAKLAAQDTTVHSAIASLAGIHDRAAVDALATLLADARPLARHEAAYALLGIALAPGELARTARAALARARTLPAPVRAWQDDEPTARLRAARLLQATVAHSHVLSQSELADCARSLRMVAPACARAYGKAVPPTLDDSAREALQAMLGVADPSIQGELLAGLLESEWPGRAVALARALERTDDAALRRRLTMLAMRTRTKGTEARAALDPVLLRMAASEPDGITARLLQGAEDTWSPRTALIRADADGQTRCGYVRDELGNVQPFVLEDGGVLLPAVGTKLEATFTRCEAPARAPRILGFERQKSF